MLQQTMEDWPLAQVVVLAMVQTTLHCNGSTTDTLQMAVTPGCPQIVLRSLMLETLSGTDNWQAMSLAILDPQTTRNDIPDSYQCMLWQINPHTYMFIFVCMSVIIKYPD